MKLDLCVCHSGSFSSGPFDWNTKFTRKKTEMSSHQFHDRRHRIAKFETHELCDYKRGASEKKFCLLCLARSYICRINNLHEKARKRSLKPLEIYSIMTLLDIVKVDLSSVVSTFSSFLETFIKDHSAEQIRYGRINQDSDPGKWSGVVRTRNEIRGDQKRKA